MPLGAPFESHIPPYDQIRVDAFTNTTYRPAWINLLSHVHSDHTQGLSAPAFSSRVFTSEDSKTMLLLVESMDDRINYDKGLVVQKRRTFAGLKRNGRNHRDLLTIALNTPVKLDIGPKDTITVTLLDANHCPGSVMFLLEGRHGAILHTGDIRAESAMVLRLADNPYIRPYLLGSDGLQEKQLEAIFLDTASMIGTRIVPSKAEAVRGLLKLIALYPTDTLFYINVWTWGYEDILIGVAEHFKTKIHVDRYKYSVLASLNNYAPSPSFSGHPEPYSFAEILTCEEATTRFHACERFNQCSIIKAANSEPPKRRTHRDGNPKPERAKKSVYINPGVVTADKWEAYVFDVSERLKEGEFVDTLRVPLSRHSTLVELQSFVAAFCPKNIHPNTLVPHLDGLDWACLPGIFARCLAQKDYETLRQSTLGRLKERFPGIDLSPSGMKKRAEQVLRNIGHPDLEQENAVGSTDETEWSEARLENVEKTKEHIETFLPWLFGHQGASKSPVCEPPARTTQKTITQDSPEASTAPIVRSEALCSTYANCPTCASVRTIHLPTNNPGAEGAAWSPLLDTGTSAQPLTADAYPTNGSSPIFQYNDQLHSPPLEPSPGSQRRDASISPVQDSAATLAEAPVKRRRLQSPCTSNPPPLDQSAMNLAFGSSSSGKRIPTVEPTHTNKFSRDPHHREPEVLCLSALTADGPIVAASNGATNPINANEHVTTILDRENIRRSTTTSLGPPSHQNPWAPATKQPPLLSESDRREQRRQSKLKERSIRAQLAKLPVGFSKALAETKSATRTGPDNPLKSNSARSSNPHPTNG